MAFRGNRFQSCRVEERYFSCETFAASASQDWLRALTHVHLRVGHRSRLLTVVEGSFRFHWIKAVGGGLLKYMTVRVDENTPMVPLAVASESTHLRHPAEPPVTQLHASATMLICKS